MRYLAYLLASLLLGGLVGVFFDSWLGFFVAFAAGGFVVWKFCEFHSCDECDGWLCVWSVGQEVLSENVVHQDKRVQGKNGDRYVRTAYRVGKKRVYYECKKCGDEFDVVRNYKEEI